MILVDTNVWVEYFRGGAQHLEVLLNSGLVVTHEYVIEELALGGLKTRDKHFHLLSLLSCHVKVGHDEIMEFILPRVRNQRAIGLVDTYLLCSAVLEGLQLYTLDKTLHRAADQLGVAHQVGR